MGHDELRTRAEENLRMTRRDIRALSSADVQETIHELQVHQIELEMQNEALRVAQLESEQSQSQYRDLFECAPVGYVMLDARGTIVRVNSAGRAILGCPPLGAATLSLRAFVASEDRPVFDELLKSASRQERCSREVRLLTKPDAASHVRLDMSFTPGRPTDCLIVLTDDSDRKRSLEALERLNHELEARVAARTALLETQNARLASELEARAKLEAQQSELEARMRASERLESLGLLAAGLAHDFNNLLVSVLGNAELLLRRTELEPSVREPVVMIKRAGRLASELTRQLLIFAGRGQLNRTAVDLPKLVAENLAMMHTRVPRRIALDVRSVAGLPEIDADRGQVNQIVLNLVTNSIEALGEAAGTIVIDMRSTTLDRHELATFQLNQHAGPGEFVVLQVRDTGCGMDAATQQRIFDPFFSTKFTGRGLGLASLAGIVQTHRGAVRVRSTLGEGSSIEVAFRLAEPRKASERPPSVADWKGSGPILLIDDDDTVRKVMAELLTMLGFDVTAAASGETGLELYRRGSPRFKLIVLDWIMPGMSGAAVLEQLRKTEPELPVILISGYSVEDLANYDHYSIGLQKPMMFDALRDAVRSMLADEATVA
jgi:PAS domain S-box-containing protein